MASRRARWLIGGGAALLVAGGAVLLLVDRDGEAYEDPFLDTIVVEVPGVEDPFAEHDPDVLTGPAPAIQEATEAPPELDLPDVSWLPESP